MDRYVALLRGINVGGKNKLPMQELVAIFEVAGCTAVRSYIQSGNVLFAAEAALAARMPALVTEAVAARFGFRVPVVLRSAGELAAVAADNPFLRTGADPGKLHVAFLADLPAPKRVAALDGERSPPDTFQVRGREIYLHCPNGVARTKLSNAWFDTQLATTSTLRNWNTVLKLVELVQEG